METQTIRACQDFFASAVPKLVDALAAKFQDVLAAQARAQQDALAQMSASACAGRPGDTMANLLAAAAPPSCRKAQRLEGRDAIKHAIMTDAKLSCAAATDTGAYRGWLLGRFRHRVSDLAGTIRQAAEELAEVGLLREDKESIRRGRRVQIYRKVPWDELTDDAQNEAVRLQIPLRIFRDGGNRPARG